MIIDFKGATDRVASLLEGIGDENLAAPSPCEEYTVGHLLNHFLGLATAFTLAARGQTGPENAAPPPRPEPSPPECWRETLTARLGTLAEAWNLESAWDGEATAGGVTLPAAIMGLVALNEVVIHGWDLAKATGQAYDLDDTVIGILTGFVGHDADDQEARAGIYAPPVKVADDATPQARLIALTGRDPYWTA